MKNIDDKLISWAISEIQNHYKDDVALLIGQVGACKTPEDEQNMAFDFFVPATERGNNLAKTFIIEDMGYDLYPISWERLEGIANICEPRMIFAFMKGEVIYAKSEEDKEHFLKLKEQLSERLRDHDITFQKAMEFLNTAMEIYQTMMFEDSLCSVRKAAGGVSCYLLNAISMVNGLYLKNGYSNLTKELHNMNEKPVAFEDVYEKILHAETIEELQNLSRQLIKTTRDFFAIKKKDYEIEQSKKSVPDSSCEDGINYDDLADWYQEARYSFRRIAYYAKIQAAEDCFLLGCYLQIEFDAIKSDFYLKTMDLLGVYDNQNLAAFAKRATELEDYLVKLLREKHADVKIYVSYEDFIRNQK